MLLSKEWPMEEQFDIYDAGMNRIGTAARSEVHAKGYWHQTFHCWLVRREGARLLARFQQRQAGKDTYPGFYDITVAGHLSAGETVRDAAREIEEGVGIAASFEELIYLHSFREEAAGEAGGVPFVDRELSHVYGLRRDVPLQAFRLQAEEVAGIYEAPADELIALFEGRLPAVPATGLGLPPGETGPVGPRLRPHGAGEAERDGLLEPPHGAGETGPVGPLLRPPSGSGGTVPDGPAGPLPQRAKASPGGQSPDGVPFEVLVRAEQFVPRPDGYYADVIRQLLRRC